MSLINKNILEDPLIILNIGLKQFADALSQQEVTVQHLDWTPPAEQDEEILDLLDGLI